MTKYLKNNNANIRVRCNVNDVVYNENTSSYQIIYNSTHNYIIEHAGILI